jgi:hypothetical protein
MAQMVTIWKHKHIDNGTEIAHKNEGVQTSKGGYDLFILMAGFSS